MIKILFDHQKFTTQKYGGISRYFANIIQYIEQTPDYKFDLGVLYSNNQYQKNPIGLLNQPWARKLFVPKLNNQLYKINQYYSNYLIKKNNFDLLHPTYYDPYFIPALKKPLVITIHDMTYERLPEYFWAQDPLTYQKRLNIERADRIIAISETTRKDLLKYTAVDPKKIEVIYHGIDISTPLQVKSVANLPENYLLFVGDRSGYKNFYLFIDAFKELSEVYPDLHLVLTGGGSLGIADQELIKRLNLQNRITHRNVTDEELNYVYQQALLFIYPSLHEGFGLPILEAFKARCPVLLSDTECFREIGADATAFFNPHSANDLKNKIVELVTSIDLRKELVEKGLARLADFPIETSMQQTLDLYRSIL